MMNCGDSQKHFCFPNIFDWVADQKEDTTLRNIMGNLCPLCEENEYRLGNTQSQPPSIQDNKLYLQLFQHFQRTGDSKAADKLTKWGVKLRREVFWSLNHVFSSDIHKPDLFQVVYHSEFRHLMTWLMAFRKKHTRKNTFDKL
jgi:hypothetical protein